MDVIESFNQKENLQIIEKKSNFKQVRNNSLFWMFVTLVLLLGMDSLGISPTFPLVLIVLIPGLITIYYTLLIDQFRITKKEKLLDSFNHLIKLIDDFLISNRQEDKFKLLIKELNRLQELIINLKYFEFFGVQKDKKIKNFIFQLESLLKNKLIPEIKITIPHNELKKIREGLLQLFETIFKEEFEMPMDFAILLPGKLVLKYLTISDRIKLYWDKRWVRIILSILTLILIFGIVYTLNFIGNLGFELSTIIGFTIGIPASIWAIYQLIEKL